ncbi:MAG: hypothetical protein QOI34_312, partial [Verrucomicrobiota bacterium]
DMVTNIGTFSHWIVSLFEAFSRGAHHG